MALWRLLLVLFALVALVAGQAGDEQAAPVEEQQAAAPEQAGAEAAAEGGEGGEQEAGGAPKQLSEEEQKQQQKLQSLYMKYLGRHLSEPCQLLLQTLLSSPPEERAEKEKDFAPGSTCGDETRAHEKAFGEKLQKGLSEKDILGPAKKRPAASRRPRPTPTPAPFFELPTLAWTPELQVGLSVLGLFVVPLVGLLAYCLVTAKSAPKAAARVAEAPAAAAKTVSSAAKRALKAKGQ